MAVQIKLVTTSFGSAIVEITFPLQRSERSQMPPVSTWHKVVGQDLIEFPNSLLGLSHGRNLQLCAHVVTNPLGKFRKNGMRCVIIVQVGECYIACYTFVLHPSFTVPSAFTRSWASTASTAFFTSSTVLSCQLSSVFVSSDLGKQRSEL